MGMHNKEHTRTVTRLNGNNIELAPRKRMPEQIVSHQEPYVWLNKTSANDTTSDMWQVRLTNLKVKSVTILLTSFKILNNFNNVNCALPMW
jgi:hypothetical protein